MAEVRIHGTCGGRKRRTQGGDWVCQPCRNGQARRRRARRPQGAVRTLAERFWEKVDKAGPVPAARPDLGPCWVWTGALDGSRYGLIWRAGRLVKAHRVQWEWAHGPIPDGLEPDHLCRNRPCVNDGHLEIVTHRENIHRGDGPCGRNARKVCCSRCGGPYRQRAVGRFCPRCKGRAKVERKRLKWAMQMQEGW